MLKENSKRLNLLITIFIIIQPILDLITKIFTHHGISITIGMFIRVVFLLYIIYQIIFKYKKRKTLYIYLVLLLYCLIYLAINNFNLINLRGLFRTIYFPTLLISLFSLKEDIKISKAPLLISLFLYLFFITIPILLGLNNTLFLSITEVSGIISILTPLLLIYFKNIKNIVIKSLLFIIYLIIILLIGTKTPFISLLISILLIYVWYIFKWCHNKQYDNLVKSFIIILLGAGLMTIIIPHINNPIKNNQNTLEERLTYLSDKKDIFNNSSLIQKLFGIGYEQNNQEIKLVEMDYYDIYYSQGIIGAILLFSIYIYILIRVVNSSKEIDLNRCSYSIGLFLIIILSLFTGHIITIPAISLIVCIIVLLLYKDKKSELLFTSVNLDVGGIEKALINLLNNIDYKKYNVTLVLEEKKGLLLDQVNKNVLVEEVRVSNDSNILLRKTINLLRKIKYILLNYDNYDFSCCYATYSLSGNLLARVSSRNNALYIHSNYTQIYHSERELRQFFDIRYLNEFKKIIFVSNEAKDDLLKYYPGIKKKSYVFNNFIDVDLIKKQSLEKIVEEKPKNTLLVFVGRLEDSSKKVKRAINLIKEIKDLDLWIIGDGPDRGVYEDYVINNKLEKRVKFLGTKLNPYPYIRISDYVILTSDYEGFPVTYLEALTLNKPIITTIPTSDDEIDIKDCAYIISKNKEQMIEEVKGILKDKKTLKKIDLKEIQKLRSSKLEEIFNEVI